MVALKIKLSEKHIYFLMSKQIIAVFVLQFFLIFILTKMKVIYWHEVPKSRSCSTCGTHRVAHVITHSVNKLIR